MTERPRRRLNRSYIVRVVTLVLSVLLATPAGAAAFEQPMGDAWWLPSPPGGTVPPATRTPAHVFGIGDSVMLGASDELRKAVPGIEIDAMVGRQAQTGIDILWARAAAGQISDVVIFALGTNGALTRRQLDDTMDALAGVQRVVFVNNSMPRTWEAPNNALIAEAVQRYPNAALADWYSLTIAQPWLLVDDAIHLRVSGAQAYAALVAPIAMAPLRA